MNKNSLALSAIRNGADSIKSVADALNCSYREAMNAVMRLKHYQRIKRVSRYPSRYEAK